MNCYYKLALIDLAVILKEIDRAGAVYTRKLSTIEMRSIMTNYKTTYNLLIIQVAIAVICWNGNRNAGHFRVITGNGEPYHKISFALQFSTPHNNLIFTTPSRTENRPCGLDQLRNINSNNVRIVK